MRKISLIIAFFVCVIAGAGTSFINTSPPRFQSYKYGNAPRHECVLSSQRYCGLYTAGDEGHIEVSNDGPVEERAYSAPIPSLNLPGGWVTVPVHLTEPQIAAVEASRLSLLRSAQLNNTLSGALYGLLAWCFFAGLSIGLSLLGKLFRRSKPVFERAVGQVTPAVQSVRDSAQSARDMARLRAEVQQAELLARKAAAEATLRRADPDAQHHSVTLRDTRRV